MRRGDYLADLISSVPSSSIVSKEKSVRQLKQEAENLTKVRDILEEFEKSQSKIFHQHTSEHIEFVKQLGKEQRNVLNNLFLTYRKQVTSLFEYQHINDCVDILAYYLGLLKVSIFSKDYKTSRRLMKKFTDELKLSDLVDMVKEFQESIKYFKLSYLNVITTLSNYLKLEQKADLQFKNIKQLTDLNKKQKQILHQIGTEFTRVSKKLLKNKEYRKTFL